MGAWADRHLVKSTHAHGHLEYPQNEKLSGLFRGLLTGLPRAFTALAPLPTEILQLFGDWDGVFHQATSARVASGGKLG